MGAEVRVEGHKLHHHLDRLAPFLRGERISPLYVEFSPVGSCNHRCTFCAYDYIGYPDQRLDAARTSAVLAEMGEFGVRGALWAGEGEPLLHPGLGEMLRAAVEAGIDNGVYSNASALTERKAEDVLPHLSFYRVSCNGGDRETYATVHQAPASHFDRVFENLQRAVTLRERAGWGVTLGMQIVLLPENLRSVEALARRAAGLGIDYLSLKPYVQHPRQSNRRWPESFRLEEIEEVACSAEQYAREGFAVLVRRRSFLDYPGRTYDHCLALPFFAFVLSSGDVYTCGPYYGDPDHRYGNINEQDFSEIWRSGRTAALHKHAACVLDTHQCMPNCRPDAVNRFLWELRHPPAHINFI